MEGRELAQCNKCAHYQKVYGKSGRCLLRGFRVSTGKGSKTIYPIVVKYYYCTHFATKAQNLTDGNED